MYKAGSIVRFMTEYIIVGEIVRNELWKECSVWRGSRKRQTVVAIA